MKAVNPVLGRRGKPPPNAKLRVMIGLIVLIVILVGGGIASASYIASRTNQSTPTPPRPTATPNVPPLFGDEFNNNNNAWNLDSDATKYSVKVQEGFMTLEDNDHKLLYELVPGNRTFSDFKLVVDAKLSKGDPINGYGVYIRGGSNQNNSLATYYRFELYGDSSYAIFKGVDGGNGETKDEKLVDYTIHSAIQKQGKVNHIVIVAKGSSIIFIVNEQKLKTIEDDGYKSGSVALFVSNLKGARRGAQAQFAKFAIYPPNV
jgi:hypothetical protein